MAATTVAEAASDMLLERKEEFARAITDALYAERPELHVRHGEAGRSKCLQDMRYNLEHLAPAVALEDPTLFARYVGWLRDMLASHGVCADDVRRSLELTLAITERHLAPDHAALVAAAVAAGLATLSPPDSG